MAGWDIATFKLGGGSPTVLGSEGVESSTWSINYSSLTYIKYKVESVDGTYSAEYFKAALEDDETVKVAGKDVTQ